MFIAYLILTTHCVFAYFILIFVGRNNVTINSKSCDLGLDGVVSAPFPAYAAFLALIKKSIMFFSSLIPPLVFNDGIASTLIPLILSNIW